MTWIADHLINIGREISDLRSDMDRQFGAGERRMDRIEKAIERSHKWRLGEVMKGVASPKEWLAAIGLTVFWLSGTISAAEIKAMLLSVLK